jgi:hypothetical protein
LRESYRLSKLPLLDFISAGDKRIRILFSLSSAAYSGHDKLKFLQINESMPVLLSKIKDNIPA